MKNKVLQVIAMMLLPLFTSCSDPTSHQTTDPHLLFKWFLSPWTTDIKTLSPDIFSGPAYNAALNSLRKGAQKGRYTIRLEDSTGTSFGVGIKTPSTIPSDTAFPLVIYLHGGTGTTLDNKGDSAWTMLEPLADSFNVYLVSPSANRLAPWWSPIGLSRILQTVRYMTLNYPVDPSRIFLAGVSDGATSCYAAANTICAPFAGFISVSGFGGMLQQLGIPLISTNLMQRPIYNVNAGHDRLYPITVVNQFLDQLQSAGVNVIRKEYPDEMHGFDYRSKEMGTLATFIRTWTKPSNSTISWTFIPELPTLCDNIISWSQNGPHPSINGFWQADTFHLVSVADLQSIIIAKVGKDTNKTAYELYNDKAVKLKPYQKKSAVFEFMMHAQSPIVEHPQLYSITLKRE